MIAVAGYAGLAGFVWLALFQGLLAAGLPIGHMAWGGADRRLPPGKRWASLAVVPLALIGAVVVVQAAGFGPALLPGLLIRPALGAFAVLFALSLLGNAASRSPAERRHGVPLALVLAGSTGALALLA
ncbi:hypothetical protein HKCCSP123_08590 [Rhodobacterales bacterium HKCCSP123]|nr:hypothetical protein [Rhodobacterales bacterium HKCCSP123]